MKRIVYALAEGGVAVVTPVINSGEDITEDQAIARAMGRLPEYAVPSLVELASLPDRSSRNRWELRDGQVVVREQ